MPVICLALIYRKHFVVEWHPMADLDPVSQALVLSITVLECYAWVRHIARGCPVVVVPFVIAIHFMSEKRSSEALEGDLAGTRGSQYFEVEASSMWLRYCSMRVKHANGRKYGALFYIRIMGFAGLQIAILSMRLLTPCLTESRADSFAPRISQFSSREN